MLEYDRIDVSEDININKANDLCECIVCKHYFVDKGLLVSMMLQLSLLNKMVMEVIFGTCVKLKP